MPTPSARPDSEIILIVTPEKYISTIAVRILIGIEQAITNVGLISFKNSSSIRIASSPPNNIFSRTELITMSI